MNKQDALVFGLVIFQGGTLVLTGWIVDLLRSILKVMDEDYEQENEV